MQNVATATAKTMYHKVLFSNSTIGFCVGEAEGLSGNPSVGVTVGSPVGSPVGEADGSPVGSLVGDVTSSQLITTVCVVAVVLIVKRFVAVSKLHPLLLETYVGVPLVEGNRIFTVWSSLSFLVVKLILSMFGLNSSFMVTLQFIDVKPKPLKYQYVPILLADVKVVVEAKLTYVSVVGSGK